MIKNRLQDGERKDMKQDSENKQCQICKGYLFEDDDVVICPHCGAPHHRDCWNTVGHCGVEADHGTDRQYDKIMKNEAETQETQGRTTRVCPHCKRESHSEDGNFCPYCGQPYPGEGATGSQHHKGGPHVFQGGMPFNIDAYGGLPKDSEIEGVKVENIAKFVGSNSHRYVPRFATLTKHNKGSWNWAAFLSPAAWCFSRKMYLYGIVFLLISLAAGICGYPFLMEYNQVLAESGEGIRSSYALISENFDKFSLVPMIMMFFGAILEFGTKILVGRFGDWLYRGFTLENVKKITSNPEIENLDVALSMAGSVSLMWMVVILLLENYLPQFIASMFW